MRFEMKVVVEVERLEGKFAPRDELEQEIFDAIDGSNPHEIRNVGADGASVYEVTSWEIEVESA